MVALVLNWTRLEQAGLNCCRLDWAGLLHAGLSWARLVRATAGTVVEVAEGPGGQDAAM